MGFSDRTERLLSAISYLPPPLNKSDAQKQKPRGESETKSATYIGTTRDIRVQQQQ